MAAVASRWAGLAVAVVAAAGASCDTAFCGTGCCTGPILELFDAKVMDAATNTPLASIEVYCDAEKTPIAKSDVAGTISFQVETEQFENCTLKRCTNLTFKEPSRAHCRESHPEKLANEQTIMMVPAVRVEGRSPDLTVDWEMVCLTTPDVRRPGQPSGGTCNGAASCERTSCGKTPTKQYDAAACIDGLCVPGPTACDLACAANPVLCNP